MISARPGFLSESFEDFIEAEAVCSEQLAERAVSLRSAEELKEKMVS